MLNAAEVFYAEKFLDQQQIDVVDESRIPGYDYSQTPRVFSQHE